jgi:hypothetical protein
MNIGKPDVKPLKGPHFSLQPLTGEITSHFRWVFACPDVSGPVAERKKL